MFVGRNGEGKTNILEAISYVCLGRSFFAANDAVVLQRGVEQFSVKATLEADRGVVYSVEVAYSSTQGSRKVKIGGADVPRRADLIGKFPVVVLSPEYAPVTSGGPGERRKLVDTTLGQAERPYLEDVIEYRKALRQRNAVLLDAKLTRRLDEQALSPWTEVLVQRGARITDRRRKFIEEFQPFVSTAVGELSGATEKPTISYMPSVGSGIESRSSSTEGVFREHLDLIERDEARAGTSLVGPHRDEFELSVNGLSVRQYASQGQHKTLLIGLKFAEFHYLKQSCEETPLLLLDDVLSELDPERNTQVFNLTRDVGQVFITAADPRLLPVAPQEDQMTLNIVSGTIGTKGHANA